MSVIHSQSNLLKLWDQVGTGFAGKGVWGASAAPPPPAGNNLGFSPFDSGPFMDLSNANKSVLYSGPGTGAAIRGLQQQNDGVRYMEFLIDPAYVALTDAAVTYIGASDLGSSLGTPPGNPTVPYQPPPGNMAWLRLDGVYGNDLGLIGPTAVVPATAAVDGSHVIGVVLNRNTNLAALYCDGVLVQAAIPLNLPGLGMNAYVWLNRPWNATVRLLASEFTEPIPVGAVPFEP